MTAEDLIAQIRDKKSFLCVGLDTEISKIPAHLRNTEQPLFEFNREIIDSTHDLTVAYKPNTAFYESAGSKGWIQLERTIRYIRDKYPRIFIIADAKRGDIGNTSERYADAFFREMDCDAITVAPYMGSDSVQPFLKYESRWVILLALTSNSGADDFQFHRSADNERLFEAVLRKSSEWGTPQNMMYVVGATRPSMLLKVREIVPNHFLLIPGAGAQGGSLSEVARYGMNSNVGILVNSSRAIIYADQTTHFAEVARQKAKEMQSEMELLLK